MYYSDLSVYCYHVSKPLPNVVNIGWLNKNHVFTQGEVPYGLTKKLTEIFLSRGKFNAEVGSIRSGTHPCEICGAAPYELSDGIQARIVGASEIWIPSGPGKYFASPAMILHYIEAHSYKPPQEFIDAVFSVDINEPFVAQDCWLKEVIG